MEVNSGPSFLRGIRLKMTIPALFVTALFCIPALLAWLGLRDMEARSAQVRDYSQALISVHRIANSVEDEEGARLALLAGDTGASGRFDSAADAHAAELQKLEDLTGFGPEAGWVSELGGVSARSRELFDSRLAPAAASGNESKTGEAGAQLASADDQTRSLLSRLVMSLEGRSNDAALSSNSMTSDVINIVIATMALAALAGLGVAMHLARHISRRLGALSEASRQLSMGNLDKRVRATGADELSQLGKAFNEMAASLQHRTEAVTNERAKLRSIHQNITDGILVFGANGFLVSANPAAEAMLSRTQDVLYGQRQTGITALDRVLSREVLVRFDQMVECWEHLQCGQHECPSYGSADHRCWLQCGTHCRNEIQGTFARKRDACERCPVYHHNSCLSLDAEYNGRSYAIEVTQILNDEGQAGGRIAVLHDMTEERHHTMRMSLLYEIANAIAINTGIDGSLQESLDLCMKAMKATSGSIMLVGEEGELTMAAHKGLSEAALRDFRQTLGQGIAGLVASSGEPLLLTEGSPKLESHGVKQIRDAVCLPIRDQTGVVGVLNLNERRTPEGFTQENLDFLAPVALQIGMALSRAQLHENVASEKEKVAAIVECMGESLCVRGPDRTILFANSAHKAIFGEDCVGKRCHELYLGRDRICSGCPLEKCFNQGKTVRRCHFVLDRLGQRRHLEATASPVRDADGRITSCIEVSRDVTEMMQIRDRLADTFWGTIRSLAEAIDAKDSYTRGHSDRVAEFAEALARHLGLDEETLSAVRCAGYLHDIGKIGIPDAILLKPGRLDEAEYAQIKRHPALSHKIIEPVEFPYDVKPLVRHHHERVDGKGYPDGLAGDQLPLGARIICIADAWEAMTSDRPYRKALSHTAAVEELLRCAGTQFDPELVSAFMELIETGGLDESELPFEQTG